MSTQPSDFTNDFYKNTSRVIQERLREWIPRGYIFNPENQYKWTDWIYPLFVYSALPIQKAADGEGIYYWKFFNENLRIDTIKSFETKQNLGSVIAKFFSEIPPSQRKEYNDIDLILNKVAIKNNPTKDEEKRILSRFLSLCELERRIMKGMVGTAKPYKKFTQSNDIKEKLKYLADFGSELTETFNQDLGGEYAGKSLRPLGLQLMLEVGKLLDANLENIKPTAMLEMMVVNPEINFDRDKYLDGEFPESDNLALEQRIVNVER